MKTKQFEEGIIYYSNTTEIFYKMKKGILYKFPNYAQADRRWEKARYTGSHSHFKIATKKQLKEVRGLT